MKRYFPWLLTVAFVVVCIALLQTQGKPCASASEDEYGDCMENWISLREGQR